MLRNDWQTDPVFPFTVHHFEYKKKIVPKNPCFYVLFLDQGRIFYKKLQGFSIFNSSGVLVIPPFLGPRIRFDRGSQGYEITVNRVLFEELTAKVINRKLLYLPENEVTFFSINEQEGNVFKGLIENLVKEWNEKKPGFRDIIRLRMIELFITLTRIDNTVSAHPGIPGPDPLTRSKNKYTEVDIHAGSKRITEILSYLEKMYYHPLTLEDLADETGFSTSYLSRYFKNQTGMCLFEYINKRRIKRACFLLKNTDKKIIDIAYEVGYNSISFFNRYFKKTLHITPMEYRKKVRM